MSGEQGAQMVLQLREGGTNKPGANIARSGGGGIQQTRSKYSQVRGRGEPTNQALIYPGQGGGRPAGLYVNVPRN